jgi:ribosomal protein S18 acetylase RimI-like enzyme
MTQTHAIKNAHPWSTSGECGIVRKAQKEDLPIIVTIHQAAFATFFLTRLGRRFLYQHYGLALRCRTGIFLVAEGASGLDGFVCGYVDPEEFYGLMRQSRMIFAMPLLSALIRQPSLATKVTRCIQRIEQPASDRLAHSCELASIAVRPNACGKGVGQTLVKAFLKQAWITGAQHVYLNTDANENEAVNALYRKLGFQLRRRFQKDKGRLMNEYVIDRMSADRQQ